MVTHSSATGADLTSSTSSHSTAASSHLSTADTVCPLLNACPDPWTWNSEDRSPEALLVEEDGRRTVVFHPYWSNGTAGVRATKSLNSNTLYYWEIQVSRRLFGTSLMFGVATKSARLHVDAFVNLLGEDEHSWALSHKGTLWHRGRCRQFIEPFRENDSAVVGLLYDSPCGSLTYFKDGKCLGVGFTDIPTTQSLYPAVCSTAAKTEMRLLRTVRSFSSLQDRCRAIVVRHLVNGTRSLDCLPIPTPIRLYINELVPPLDRPTGEQKPEQDAYKSPSVVNKQRTPRISLKFSASGSAVSRYWPPASWQGAISTDSVE